MITLNHISIKKINGKLFPTAFYLMANFDFEDFGKLASKLLMASPEMEALGPGFAATHFRNSRGIGSSGIFHR